MTPPIRVLIVDDSPVMRDIMLSMFEEAEDFSVVGQAGDGQEAIALATRLHPDVITMDIRMPGLNGLEITRYIMRTLPTPIIVVANNIYEADLNIAFNAIAAGALTVVEKPRGLDTSNYVAVRDQLLSTARLVARVKVTGPTSPRPATGLLKRLPQRSLNPPPRKVDLIAIAASTGGPGVLSRLLEQLPTDFAVPIVIVQHITAGFAPGLAHWLDSLSKLKVRVARHGEHLAPGEVLLAPDDMHLQVTPGGIVQLEQSAPVDNQRPSANLMFTSVARVYGDTALGVILTGMGEDGAAGLTQLHHAGGYVVAQNEESCVVFGMPKAAIELGVVDRVLSPAGITALLNNLHIQAAPQVLAYPRSK